MKKVFGVDAKLQDILGLANIDSNFIEVTVHDGIAIIQPKSLCCSWCGKSKDVELKMKDGVLLCDKCMASDINIVHDGNLSYPGRSEVDASGV